MLKSVQLPLCEYDKKETFHKENDEIIVKIKPIAISEHYQ